MEWNVKNAINRDVERQQLNKILRDIEQRLREVSERITSSGGSTDVRDLIGEMVSNNVERGINVTYDPVKKVLNFVVPPPPVVPAPEEPDVPDVDYVEEAPYDGAAYVRRDRAWEMLDNRIDSLSILEGPGLLAITSFDDWEVRVLLGVSGEIEITDGDGDEDNPTIGLADVTDSGEGALLAITRDSKGRVSGTKPATITGTADEIDVADGDAVDGLPTISLADLADAGGGEIRKFDRDSKGRVSGTSAATTDDLDEGSTNLYYTDARADARISVQKGQPNGLASLDADAKLEANQLPALAITETFVVNDEAEMLALTAQQGDVAVRLDQEKSYILTVDPPSVLANWQELLFPTSAGGSVSSVGLSAPVGFSVGGSPITSSGVLSLSYAAGYQGYTSAEASKLSGIAAGATVGADWSVNLSNIPANISAWAGISPSSKYNTPTGTTAQYIRGDGTLAAFPSIPAGTVTSVGLSAPTGLTVSGSPVTGAGTLTLSYASGYQGYTSAEANKLSGIAAGAQVNVPTNLAQGTRTTTTVPITSSTGSSATLQQATTSLAGVMSSADKSKLDGVAANATVGANWNVNLTNIPANISAWAGINPSSKYDASNPAGYTNNVGTVTSLTAGLGMNFSNITSSGAIALGTPSSITSDGPNQLFASSHTHALLLDTLAGRTDVAAPEVDYPANISITRVGAASGTGWPTYGVALNVLSTDKLRNGQLYFGINDLHWRSGTGSGPWTLKKVWDENNFNPATKQNAGEAWVRGGSSILVPTFTGNLNDATGFHAYFAGNTATNKPGASNYFTWGMGWNTGEYGVQWASRNGAAFFRNKENNTWTPWAELWHSGNLADSGWQALTLQSGWSNAGSPYQTAAVRKFGNFVKLRGMINLGSSTAFTLPSGYRPPGEMQFCVSGYDAFPTIVRVRANGQVDILYFGPSSTQVSLDNISFYVD